MAKVGGRLFPIREQAGIHSQFNTSVTLFPFDPMPLPPPEVRSCSKLDEFINNLTPKVS